MATSSISKVFTINDTDACENYVRIMNGPAFNTDYRDAIKARERGDALLKQVVSDLKN